MKDKNLRLLLEYLKPFRGRLVGLGVLLAGSIILQLLAPQVIRRLLDGAQSGAATNFLLFSAALFLLVVLVQKVLALFSVYFSEDLGWAATNRLRVDLAEHCLRLDMSFHKSRTPGELIERIDGDVGKLAESFAELFVQMTGNALLAIGILFVLFREDWRFALLGLAYAAIVLLYMRAMRPLTVRAWRNVRQAFAELFAYLEERYGGTEDIRANGGEAYVLFRLHPLLARVQRVRVHAYVLGGFTYHGSRMVFVLALVITLGLAGLAYLRGEMTIGSVFLMAAYINLLQQPVTQIRRHMGDYQAALASAIRVREFFGFQPAVADEESARLPDEPPEVCFAGVSFGYKDSVPAPGADADGVVENGSPVLPESVLRDISFTLPAGQVLGLLGRTGSGKTTLARLLFRLYDVDQGAITLAGVDVRALSLAGLRRDVGLVTQDVQLFGATVRDNLTLFRNYDSRQHPVSDRELRAAIDTLGLNDWFATLPDGLDTVLTSGGQGLSAGEAQLLALARVFLRDPKLVILDEASSRLDPGTESRLEQAIDRLLAGRTGIVIAHRLHTVQRADALLILEEGRALEFGAREDLAADPASRFSQLLQVGLTEVLA